MFLTTIAVFGLFFVWNDKDENRLDGRLQELANPAAFAAEAKSQARPSIARALPKLTNAFLPTSEKPRARLKNQLLHAGYYHPEALTWFLAVKMLLVLLPWLPAVALSFTKIVPWSWSLGVAGLFGLCGLIVPSLWLSWQKNQRQITFRTALPDVLDVFVICLEGGASLPSALARVTEELRLAHPELGIELAIIEREMQMGRSLGESFMRFAERSDLEEVRSLANCMNQTDRLGGGLVTTLRIQAESMRDRRLHYAEEKAQKAGTKILFPTLLLIFPAIFVILVGPAAFQVYSMLNRPKADAPKTQSKSKNAARGSSHAPY